MNPSNRTLTWRIVCTLLACLLLAACNRVTLYNELDEQQANQVMGALLGAGVASEKAPSSSKKGWEVQVNRGDFPYAMQVLNSQGLPQATYRSMGEIFKKEGFVSSAMDERARYTDGLQQEIARTLSRIDGVVEARVHIALPPPDPLGGRENDSSASVIIFERPGAKLRDRETDLKVFIKDSVEGLADVNKVTIKFFTIAAPSATGAQSGVPVAMSSFGPIALLAVVVAVLLGLGIAFRGKLKARLVPVKDETPPAWSD